IPTLPGDESTSELEPADDRLLPGARSKVKSGLVAASGPEQRHPLALDDGEKNDKEGPTALPQARESIAGLPTLLDGGGNVDYKPAGASLPIQLPAGRDQASGRDYSTRPFRQRRRHHDADEEEGSVYSDAEHSEDDVVQPPLRKRRKGATCSDSTRGA
ncbi:hypothetical protein C8A01DRAFT_20129, partial [Parachaetomium inaequale]